MTPPPTALEAVARLQGLLAAATPAPWGDHCGELTQKVPHPEVPEAPWDFYTQSADIVREGEEGGFIRQADMDAVIALRNAAPALLAIAEATAENMAFRDEWSAHVRAMPRGEINKALAEAGGWLQRDRDAYAKLAKALAEFARAVGR